MKPWNDSVVMIGTQKAQSHVRRLMGCSGVLLVAEVIVAILKGA